LARREVRETRIRRKTHRLIASRYPTVGVFDDIADDAEDVRAAFMLEALTNDRLTSSAVNRIAILPRDEIITGPGATLVMAAFLHADEQGGRFTDGRLGAWYASHDVTTAIHETVYHNTRRLKMSAGGFPNRIQMRELIATIDCSLVDVRGLQGERPELYHANDYTQSQAFALQLRWPKVPPAANGILFHSVRHAGGTNVCVFWPSKVTLPVLQGDHLDYVWNAAGEVEVSKRLRLAI
jgi:RES domain